MRIPRSRCPPPQRAPRHRPCARRCSALAGRCCLSLMTFIPPVASRIKRRSRSFCFAICTFGQQLLPKSSQNARHGRHTHHLQTGSLTPRAQLSGLGFAAQHQYCGAHSWCHAALQAVVEAVQQFVSELRAGGPYAKGGALAKEATGAQQSSSAQPPAAQAPSAKTQSPAQPSPAARVASPAQTTKVVPSVGLVNPLILS